ncbi:hypothetical protein FUA26_02970 [Seonamhaeicola algicola]|uniref:Uncharacterized protein n=1 Tax=Seonamhaeicola algicola TaxID=1719036 RepID=A0A5C7AX81_9FLAO|nr:hypothetical protein [Seonamhaeicola algicola]TXE12777.1 hypothetical protein FUA26_02970 [Seonamhaeicola algicola]
MSHSHSFHIPVMGIAFTIDTPLKVAHFGIDSVVSLVDDILLEKLRKMYCEKFELQYNEITNKVKDFRAKRITSYLNLMNHLVDEKYSALKNVSLDKIEDIKTHLSMLPSGVVLKQEFTKLLKNGIDVSEVKNWLATHLKKGRIDVNIMTKVDKENTFNNQKLPVEYNDAHAALRGFANSKLEAAVVLSAGLNPRLYAYMAQFDDFFPNENGLIKKKIILKVSDYRSALVQGKFLAKKGLWVSEYRVESGLNCGGHAFATDGYLLGPVLHEFKEKRGELINTITDVLNNALKAAGKVVPKAQLKIAISAQGGVGTHKEHAFLIDEYKLDSVGWGSPFLLVSEATTVDNNTLKKLVKANENDLYLSDISPLGVPFNNLKNNTKDAEKNNLIFKGRPGSCCPKKFVALNKEFGEKGICTASREYQYLKLKALDAKNLSADAYEKAFNSITQKSCTCVGLGTSALLVHNLSTKVEGEGVSVCPGPNMAYYSKVMSLKNITDHIYGRDNMVTTTKRPNIFIKELNIYVDFILKKLDEVKSNMTKKEANYILTFTNNLNNGITYYKSLFNSAKNVFDDVKKQALSELDINERLIKQLQHKIKQ